MITFLATNIGLILFFLLFVAVLGAAICKMTILDFIKANFGLMILLGIFSALLAVSFHVYHEANQNPVGKDFLAWLEQKAGEVLASIMTVIVGARNTNQRAGDGGNGNGNGNNGTSGSKTVHIESTTSSVTGASHP